MKLYLNRTTSEGSTLFFVSDERGRTLYRVMGDRNPLVGSAHVLKSDGEPVASIQRVGPVALSRYNVYINGKKQFSILQEFTGTRPRFLFRGVSWQFRGDILLRSFDLVDVDGSVLMIHGRCWSCQGDSFGLCIQRDDLALSCLCAAIVVDSLAQSGGIVEAIPSG